MTDRWQVLRGDCIETMRGMEAESVDAVICDPPYMIGFMGKEFDRPENNPAANVELWREALRVAKPGAHLLAFGGTRTSHRLTCAIEDGGWVIRDALAWCFGSGFPKSLNLGDGWGTALKPAYEPIVLARKPLTGTVAANVERFGTGAINVDGCRVGTGADKGVWPVTDREKTRNAYPSFDAHSETDQTSGRWPPNLLLSHLPECRRVGTKRVDRDLRDAAAQTTPSQFGAMGGSKAIGTVIETVPAYDCAPGCQVRVMGEQSGERPGAVSNGSKTDAGLAGSDTFKIHEREQSAGRADTGTAARFFPQFELTELDQWDYEDHNQNDPTDTTSPAKATSDEAAASSRTRKSGNESADPSPTDSKSTTSTGTSKTTGSKTSKSSTPQPTSGSTPVASDAGGSGLSPASSAESQSQSTESIGISAGKGGHSTDAANRAISDASLRISKLDAPFKYTAKASRAEREAGTASLPGKTGAAAVERQEGTDGLNSPRAGAGRTGVEVHNFHPT